MLENGRKAKILYVEDDQTLAMLYGLRLEQEGFEVVHCDDGESAIKAAQSVVPDLVLVDLMMPAVDGFTVIGALRGAAGGPPPANHPKIVVLSALSQPEDIQKARDLGADEYLVKSQVTIDEIMQNIRRVLGIPEPAPGAAGA